MGKRRSPEWIIRKLRAKQKPQDRHRSRGRGGGNRARHKRSHLPSPAGEKPLRGGMGSSEAPWRTGEGGYLPREDRRRASHGHPQGGEWSKNFRARPGGEEPWTAYANIGHSSSVGRLVSVDRSARVDSALRGLQVVGKGPTAAGWGRWSKTLGGESPL